MKTPIYLICLAALAASCGEPKPAADQGYTVEGNLKGIQSGKVKLSTYDDETRTSKVIDSTTITNGKFTLKGKIENPEMVSVVADDYWGFQFFLENSKISIEADTTGSEHYDWIAYGGSKGATMKNFKVTGSTNEDQNNAIENNPSLKQYDPLMIELGKAYQSTTDKEEGYKIKEKIDSLRELSSQIRKKLIDSFITANPSSPAGAYLFSNFYTFNSSMTAADMESVLKKFTGAAQSTAYYKRMSETLNKKKALLPGKTAPDFTLLKRDSSQFTLSSLRGKYVMLDFWASWCVPCRKAIPHWKEVYKQYHDKGFEIVGVTNDVRWKDWFKALEEEKMPWIQVADEFPIKNSTARVISEYMAPYLPTYVLLDKEGKIVLHNASHEEIEAKLKEVFGN